MTVEVVGASACLACELKAPAILTIPIMERRSHAWFPVAHVSKSEMAAAAGCWFRRKRLVFFTGRLLKYCWCIDLGPFWACESDSVAGRDPARLTKRACSWLWWLDARLFGRERADHRAAWSSCLDKRCTSGMPKGRSRPPSATGRWYLENEDRPLVTAPTPGRRSSRAIQSPIHATLKKSDWKGGSGRARSLL